MSRTHWFIASLIVLFTTPLFSTAKVSLWHAYRGAEKQALEQVALSFNLAHPDIEVSLLAVPFDAFKDKLNVQIPLGNGPDIFIGGSSAAGYWAEQGYILPLESFVEKKTIREYFDYSIQAFNFMYPDALWGMPANTKNLALFYNRAFIKNPPQNMNELLKTANNFTRPSSGPSGKWGLNYEAGNFYYHAIWLHGFGGRMYKKMGTSSRGFPVYLPLLHTSSMKEAFLYVKNRIMAAGVMPPAPSNTLITRLFNTGKGLYVINGQWYRGEITPRVKYGVSAFPVINETGTRPRPFLTVEGYYLCSSAKDQLAAIKVIKYFSSAAMQKVMALKGKHTPAHKKTFNYSLVRDDKVNQIFVSIAKTAIQLPNGPEATLGWGPFTAALSGMYENNDLDQVLSSHQKSFMKEIEDFRKTPGLFKQMGYSEKSLD